MGLLGQGWDDPQSAAIMALAGGLLQGNPGMGLLGANQAFLQAKQAKAQGLLSELQLEDVRSRMDDQRRQREFLQNLPDPQFVAGQQALANGGGPTLANAAAIRPPSPHQNLLLQGVRAGAVPLGEYLGTLKPRELPFNKVDPKDYTPESIQAFATSGGDYTKLVPVREMKLAPGGQVYNPYAVQPGDVINDPFKPFTVGANGQLSPNQLVQEYELRRATASAPKMPAINLNDPTAVARAGMDLQDKVRGAFKDDNVIANQFKAMREAVKNPSAQGDTALLYSFFKVLDPASTVREGEIDMVKQSRSIPDRFKGMAEKLASGKFLMPQEREDILNQAKRQLEVRKQRSNQDVQAYRENAKRLALDPNLYVPDPYDGLNFSASGADSIRDAARAELERRRAGK